MWPSSRAWAWAPPPLLAARTWRRASRRHAGASSTSSSAPPSAAAPAPAAASGRAGGGDSAYVESSRAVQDAVGRIRGLIADIQKETSKLGTAQLLSGCRSRVYDKFRAASAEVKSAKEHLQGIYSGSLGSESSGEKNMRKLTQEKLFDALLKASQDLEVAHAAFDEAAQAREEQLAAKASEDHSSSISTSASETSQQIQLQEASEVERAEVQFHSDMVEEYAQDVSHLHREIQGLQRAMVDLAEHAASQGETLDCIVETTSRASSTTDQAREQLVQANEGHARGSKLLYCLMFLAACLAAAVVIVAVKKSQEE
mmetsp:Transcript_99022/g.317602  ORF Transcript_99022/g.317602 Transcript_99022/m.317602 type:complete len:314 (+) Transcript_99022:1534-2475(+)